MADNGLTGAEVAASRAAHGSNELAAHRKNGFWRQFAAGFGDPIIKVLLAALSVNVLFFFHRFDWFESAGIALAIFLSTFVSALSEYGSESAFEQLQAESARVQCRVRRGGRLCQIPLGDVVVGDTVLLQAGERVPADGYLTMGSLSVDTAALNGEGQEVSRRAAARFEGNLAADGDLFRGSVVCSGTAEMRVARVGAATLYGQMAGELHESAPESPLKQRLSGLARTVSRLGYIAAALVAVADLFHSFIIDTGGHPADMANSAAVVTALLHALTLAVTMTVVAVPEGLPMMITVVLSSNIRRMLRDHVLVRRPVGIETAGNINLLFTDKTGTLTGGQLRVTHFVCGNGRELPPTAIRRQPLGRYVAYSCLCNTESTPVGRRAIGGNATDRALTQWQLPAASALPEVCSRIPFDSRRKWSAVRLREPSLTLIKGAPELLLSASRQYLTPDGVACPLTDRAPLNAALTQLTDRAVRVLALAMTEEPIRDGAPLPPLTLLGVVGIHDALRREIPQTVRQVRQAGIQVVMLTGDNRETATAVAKEAGILSDRSLPKAVLDSAALAALSDPELKARLPHLRVVARMLPSDKSRLVRVAQECGLVVGMTGDGVNDAPALKRADVGFAMGSGTEVAKEAGDIVITDNNFASIARAILYGRTIFKNIRRFIVFQLTMNLCAVGVSVISPFIGIESPVTVIQMLWINLIMDTLAGLAFAGEPPLPEYMEEPPPRREEPVLNRSMVGQIAVSGGYTLMLCLLFLKWERVGVLFRTDTDPLFRLSAFFALFIFSGICNSFNARTGRINPLANLRHNPTFCGIMLAVAGIQLFLLYFGGSLFRTAPLTFTELTRVLLLSATVIPVDCLRKIAVGILKKRKIAVENRGKV